MPNPLSTGASYVEFAPLAADPPAPDAGALQLYAKSVTGDLHVFKQTSLGTTDLNAAVTFPTVQEILSADRTYYVRTDGNDSNTGLVNTSGGAFLTVQSAWNAYARLNLNGYSVTIQIADGTYTGSNTLYGNPNGSFNSTPLTIKGNTSSPANVIISTTSADCFLVLNGARVFFTGMRLQTTTSGYGLNAQYNSFVTYSLIDFGAMLNGIHKNAYFSSTMKMVGPYSISGSAIAHDHNANVATQLVSAAANITVTGRIVFSGFYAGNSMAMHQYGGVGAPKWVGSSTFTVSIASPAVVSITSHGLSVGDSWVPNTSGALPTGLTAGATYYVIAAGFGANSFEVSTTSGGAAVNTSGTQSGTHNWFSINGQKYLVHENGVIQSNASGDVNYLPGNVAGAASVGGVYD